MFRWGLVVLAVSWAFAMGVPMFFAGGFDALLSGLPSFGETPPAVIPSVTLDGPDSHLLSGVAEGNELASDLASPMCSGHISTDPGFRLETVKAGVVHFNVAATGDLVLVVQTATGEWLCDDDGGEGMLPRIVHPLGIGEHRVWVGAYSGDEHIPYTLTISEDMPGLALPEATDENKPAPTPAATTHRRRRRRRGRHPMGRQARSMQSSPEPATPPPDNSPMQAPPTAFAPPSPQLQAGGSLGMLTINTQPWSRIRVNGRLMGRTPRHNLIVPVGRLTVEVQEQGTGPWISLHVMVRPGAPARLNHSFRGPSPMVFVD